MKLYIWILFIGLLYLLTTEAKADEKKIMIYGTGTKSCGSYLPEYQTYLRYKQTNNILITDDSVFLTYLSWIQGFLTAVNELNNMHIDDIQKGTDYDGIMSWIDNYCQKHPLENIQTATTLLMYELVKKQTP